ncbi:hypothetical protein MLD38_023089 [Melastoma candidum]|uniref:Uncharacterized protein n=1 Tax=Melastoma candidum TaxID=119954 RepID=A0ACB9QLZ0_9MYRT|nr:hypothetical protein MLD38_023089 [Melastoma candidum]
MNRLVTQGEKAGLIITITAQTKPSVRHRAGMGDKKKAATVFVRLVSAAGTGFFYVKKKNPRKMQEKLEFRKYDPRVNRHVLFTEAKMK